MPNILLSWRISLSITAFACNANESYRIYHVQQNIRKTFDGCPIRTPLSIADIRYYSLLHHCWLHYCCYSDSYAGLNEMPAPFVLAWLSPTPSSPAKSCLHTTHTVLLLPPPLRGDKILAPLVEQQRMLPFRQIVNWTLVILPH